MQLCLLSIHPQVHDDKLFTFHSRMVYNDWMDSSKEINVNLDNVERVLKNKSGGGSEGKCVVCRIVFLFSVAVFALVVLFMVTMKPGKPAKPLVFQPLPDSMTPRLTEEETLDRLNDLRRMSQGLPPLTASSTTNANERSTEKIAEQSSIKTPQQ